MSFIFATLARLTCEGVVKDRGQVGVYLMKGRAKGMWLSFAYPIAWGVPESGTPQM
jgi:hypothetical protein